MYCFALFRISLSLVSLIFVLTGKCKNLVSPFSQNSATAIVVLGLKSLAAAVNFCLGASLHSVELITEIGNWKCFKPTVALWVKHHQSHRGFLRAAFDHCQRLWMGLSINRVKCCLISDQSFAISLEKNERKSNVNKTYETHCSYK